MTAPGRFLERWSRLKRQREPAPAPAEPPVAAPAPDAVPFPGEAVPVRAAAEAGTEPELPALETLGLESDFTSFLKKEVSESLRRAALRKLFSDPHFNRMDGLDVYIDDYSLPDPIPPDMLERLRQVQTLLRDEVASAEGVAGADEPTGETPTGETPTGETPTGETPTGETPTGETPTGETPTGETPTGETPTGQATTGKTASGAAEETTAGETPFGEASSRAAEGSDPVAEAIPHKTEKTE